MIKLKSILLEIIESKLSLHDIWGGKNIPYGSYQLTKTSPIWQVQDKLQEKLPKWSVIEGFKPDNDFRGKTARAIVKFRHDIDPKHDIESKVNGKAGSALLKAQVIDKSLLEELDLTVEEIQEDILDIATTLTAEAQSAGKEGMLGVAHVINNRAKKNHHNYGNTPHEQVLANGQYSMWNSWNSGTRSKDDIRRIYNVYNSPHWPFAVQLAKKLTISSGLGADVTKGADHYYAYEGPQKLTDEEGKLLPKYKGKWMDPDSGFVQTYEDKYHRYGITT